MKLELLFEYDGNLFITLVGIDDAYLNTAKNSRYKKNFTNCTPKTMLSLSNGLKTAFRNNVGVKLDEVPHVLDPVVTDMGDYLHVEGHVIMQGNDYQVVIDKDAINVIDKERAQAAEPVEEAPVPVPVDPSSTLSGNVMKAEDANVIGEVAVINSDEKTAKTLETVDSAFKDNQDEPLPEKSTVEVDDVPTEADTFIPTQSNVDGVLEVISQSKEEAMTIAGQTDDAIHAGLSEDDTTTEGTGSNGDSEEGTDSSGDETEENSEDTEIEEDARTPDEEDTSINAVPVEVVNKDPIPVTLVKDPVPSAEVSSPTSGLGRHMTPKSGISFGKYRKKDESLIGMQIGTLSEDGSVGIMFGRDAMYKTNAHKKKIDDRKDRDKKKPLIPTVEEPEPVPVKETREELPWPVDINETLRVVSVRDATTEDNTAWVPSPNPEPEIKFEVPEPVDEAITELPDVEIPDPVTFEMNQIKEFKASIDPSIANVLDDIPPACLAGIAEFTMGDIDLDEVKAQGKSYCINHRWYNCGDWFAIDYVSKALRIVYNSKNNFIKSIPHRLCKEWIALIK